LAQQFVAGEAWPIGCGALAALIDLGMSNFQIADYFSVDLRDVTALRERYQLD
jgi:hypothetical protein